MEELPDEFRTSWQANAKALKNQIKGRLCAVYAHHSLRNSQRKGVVKAAVIRAKSTGLIVARVFKGNVVFARFKGGIDKQEWLWKRRFFPNLRTFLGTATGGLIATGQPVYAEALLDCSSSKLTLTVKSSIPNGPDVEPSSSMISIESEESRMVRTLRALAIPVIGNACYIFMHGLNQTEVYGIEKLHKFVTQRSTGQGLITVSNHVAAMDDPLVLSSLLSPQLLMDAANLRWTLCATDRCFTNPATSAFFRCVKVLPLARGQGVHQQGVDMALAKLNSGDWVHIFPEGSRSRDGGKTVGHAKRGVGRLILDACVTPVVVPFVHVGMDDVMPIGTKIPHVGKKVTVLVGDPIELDDILNDRINGMSKFEIYDIIAAHVGQKLQDLKKEADQIVLDSALQIEKQKSCVQERAHAIWEYVDWEAQGAFVGDEEDSSLESNAACSRRSSNVKEIETYKQVHNEAINSDVQNLEDMEDRFFYGRGVTARLRAYADPAVFMGFAARGLFFNRQGKWNLNNGGLSKCSVDFKDKQISKFWMRYSLLP